MVTLCVNLYQIRRSSDNTKFFTLVFFVVLRPSCLVTVYFCELSMCRWLFYYGHDGGGSSRIKLVLG